MIATIRETGFSEAARILDEAALRSRRLLHESISLGIEGIVDNELSTIWEECRQSNWDGFQAAPLNVESFFHARALLDALPPGFPAPSIGAEPDGDLTLDWHHSLRRTLSVSVSPMADLNYAAILGPNRRYGTEVFFEVVPEAILDLIRQVFGE